MLWKTFQQLVSGRGGWRGLILVLQLIEQRKRRLEPIRRDRD